MRLSITVDPELLEEARKLTGARTKRETVELALREVIRRRRLEALIALGGSGIVDMEPEELQAWRESGVERYDGRAAPAGFLGLDSLPAPAGVGAVGIRQFTSLRTRSSLPAET